MYIYVYELFWIKRNFIVTSLYRNLHRYCKNLAVIFLSLFKIQKFSRLYSKQLSLLGFLITCIMHEFQIPRLLIPKRNDSMHLFICNLSHDTKKYTIINNNETKRIIICRLNWTNITTQYARALYFLFSENHFW